MAGNTGLEQVLLSIADDELVIGHRHSEWTGWAPHIEEDIAFSSIAQDEIGHAAVFYRMLAEETGRDADAIALGRVPEEYLSAHICERQNGDWAYTIARHFLYEVGERLRLESLAGSSFTPLAHASVKLLREERYHQMHADAWLRRLAHGPVEGRHEVSMALARAIPDAEGLFEPLPNEDESLAHGILGRRSQDLLEQWREEVVERIEAAGLALTSDEGAAGVVTATSSGEMIDDGAAGSTPAGGPLGLGGRRGIRSPEFAALWEDLTKTYREEPAATW